MLFLFDSLVLDYLFTLSFAFFLFFLFVCCDSGQDAVKFLQGLTTRDVTCFDPKLRAERLSGGHTKEEEVSGVYTAFLNNKGKVSFDAFVMPFGTDKQASGVGTTGTAVAPDSPSEPDLLLDCDVELKNTIMKHLKMYKLRAKVAISDVSDELSVWSVFSDDASGSASEHRDDPVLPLNQVFVGHQDDGDGDDVIVHAMADPRLPALGQRIIVPSSVCAVSAISAANLDDASPPPPPPPPSASASIFEITDARQYTAHRMGLGVAEGTELVARMPLECNLAALNAVSFDKGCYVGQELVARTHYKGKIRKRIMPFQVGGDDDGASASSAESLLAMLGSESENDVSHLTLRAQSVSSEIDGDDQDAVRMSRGKPPARLVALAPSGTVGLAMVRLEALERSSSAGEQGDRVSDLVVKPLELELVNGTAQDDGISDHSVPVSVHCPHWWPIEYTAE